MAIPASLGSLGHIGIRGSYLDVLPADDVRTIAREVERLGFGSIWVNEATGKDPFAHAAIILAVTDRLVVATGIANVYGRDACAMVNAGRTLAEAFPGRFVLGIGVSHAPIVRERGHEFARPYEFLRTYLEDMERAPYRGPRPQAPVPTVLGALGPRMLRLAREHGLGAHPYFVPVDHTRGAREILGGDAFLVPEVALVTTSNREKAREVARPYFRRHLSLENYVRNLRRLGWPEAELDGEPHDRLLDALVAWGGPEALDERIRDHVEAGADHVALHPIATIGQDRDTILSLIRELADELWS